MELVHILVGPRKKKFSVHQKLLSASPYFEEAFNGPFLEAKTMTLTLKEDAPEIFSAFIEWLYVHDSNTAKDFDIDNLISLYIFSDKIQNVALKDYAMDILQNTMKEGSQDLNLDQIKRIFKDLPDSPTAPLRRFAAAMLYYEIMCRSTTKPSWILDVFKHVPAACLEVIKFQRHRSQECNELKEDPRRRHTQDYTE